MGKLILTTEKAKKEEEEGIVQLRILRIQVTLHPLNSMVTQRSSITAVLTGSHREDHEDAEEGEQRGSADGAGGDPEEHVPSAEEDDQGADRVAHRAQVHAAGRGEHQHLHLPRLILSPPDVVFIACNLFVGLDVLYRCLVAF